MSSLFPHLLLASSLAVLGCTNDITVGRLNDVRAEASQGDASSAACSEVRCRGPVLECGDCLDNDEDGLVDMEDPDCFGPCSDNEASLAGRDRVCANDSCFFEFDCGQGNDGPCTELVPNGCDCHGCCEAGSRAALLGSIDDSGAASCTAEALDDPARCLDCSIDETCFNACDDCELCFSGAEPSDECPLVDGCRTPLCPDGVEPCDEACGLRCPEGFACVTGCCIDVSGGAASDSP